MLRHGERVVVKIHARKGTNSQPSIVLDDELELCESCAHEAIAVAKRIAATPRAERDLETEAAIRAAVAVVKPPATKRSES